jgi:hypothetical protein
MIVMMSVVIGLCIGLALGSSGYEIIYVAVGFFAGWAL